MSLTIIEGAQIFDPRDLGEGDLVLAGGEILALGSGVAAAFADSQPVERIDGRGRMVLPGLVDVLTHPCGGGGEGGFGNRTGEIEASAFIRGGVTHPVGALGTDSIGRSLDVLYGTVMSLRSAGLAACMYSGAYRVPAPTLTGDISRDLYLVDPVIGVGEVAISDHRGTQPTVQELRRLAAETQLGGILAGAGGTVLVHVGDGPDRLQPLRDVVAACDLSPRVLFPTHVNRSTALLDEAADWAVQGGYVDVTVSTTPELLEAGDIAALDAVRRLLEAGAPMSQITLSSDAGGSLPLYIDGELRGLTAAAPGVLLDLLLQALAAVPELFPIVLAGLTCNPASALRLPDTGRLRAGGPADLLVLDPDRGELTDVFCGGRRLLRDAAPA